MADKPLTNSINALTAYINEVTGGTDDNLSDAIATLADGYSQDDVELHTIATYEFSNVAQYNAIIPLSAFDDYKTVIIAPNVTFASADWLYAKKDGFVVYSTGSAITRLYPKIAFYKNKMSSNTTRVYLTDESIKKNNIVSSVDTFSDILFYPYKSTNTMSGTITVYGSNIDLNKWISEMNTIFY